MENKRGQHLNYSIISKIIEENSTVLDLGCGDGTLLKSLIDTKHVKAKGIEINQDCVISCLEKGVCTIQGDIDEGLTQFSDKEYDYTKVIYVKLHGYNNKEVNFRIESNEAPIYYLHNDYRGIKSFKDKLTDCSKPFYYIGDYDILVNKGYFYQETFYGKINAYYKGKVNSDEPILINEDQKHLVKNDVI